MDRRTFKNGIDWLRGLCWEEQDLNLAAILEQPARRQVARRCAPKPYLLRGISGQPGVAHRCDHPEHAPDPLIVPCRRRRHFYTEEGVLILPPGDSAHPAGHGTWTSAWSRLPGRDTLGIQAYERLFYPVCRPRY